ncbi:hypothetical protein [Paracoccus homiensis]|uniref:Uncharacterized protein n=1 Tax=Paracoccus homiensis TaxID=364199 RepID=A0A1I0JNV1_9RHOB|nr:hypothetical protein [Paracoccus homiensis]SEU11459.1 hypothetical protein SAMN04489858_1371 [Paracoccus homiensis]
MGDFEDIFGAGANVEAIIGYDGDEDHFEYAREIIEHHLWFPDLDTAISWEKENIGTPFVRKRSHGGFLVTLKDQRSSGSRWKTSTLPRCDVEKLESKINLVFAEGLENVLVQHGEYSLRLASDTSSGLVSYLESLRGMLPYGREHMSPIVIPQAMFRAHMLTMPYSISYDYQLGMGVMAVFHADHHLLIGRWTAGNVYLWPWILQMDCLGGDPPYFEDSEICFLCDQHDLLETGIPIPSHELCGISLNDEFYQRDYRHYITKQQYSGNVRPKDLALCVKRWIEILSRFDQRIDINNRPPADVFAVANKQRMHIPDANALCNAFACAIAMKMGIETPVSVILEHCSDLQALPQATPARLRMSATTLWRNARVNENASIPNMTDLHHLVIPETWRETVKLYPRDWPRDMPINGFRISWDNQSRVGTGSFHASKLNASQRKMAKKFVEEFTRSPECKRFEDVLSEPPKGMKIALQLQSKKST